MAQSPPTPLHPPLLPRLLLPLAGIRHLSVGGECVEAKACAFRPSCVCELCNVRAVPVLARSSCAFLCGCFCARLGCELDVFLNALQQQQPECHAAPRAVDKLLRPCRIKLCVCCTPSSCIWRAHAAAHVVCSPCKSVVACYTLRCTCGWLIKPAPWPVVCVVWDLCPLHAGVQQSACRCCVWEED